MFSLPDNDWKNFFDDNKDELLEIEIKIEKKKEELAGLRVFPPCKDIFKAFELCAFKDIKIVILGQDCYHGEKQANGLCFSVNNGVSYPPSLKNIIKECYNDVGLKLNNDFTYLAKQGILLLNSSLTVHERLAGSHLDIWEKFTDNVIKYINDFHDEPVIYILWGNYAKNKKKFISDKHFIIEGTHPSPLSANRGGYFGNKYFSKSNDILLSLKKTPIIWDN